MGISFISRLDPQGEYENMQRGGHNLRVLIWQRFAETFALFVGCQNGKTTPEKPNPNP